MQSLPPHINPQYGYGLSLPIEHPAKDKWYVEVPGLPGRYLYTSNTVSKSFDNDLKALGYDWFFPSYASAMEARDIYYNQGQPQLDASYSDHNSARPYPYRDSLYTDGSIGPSNDLMAPSRLFDTEKEALTTLIAYRTKYHSVEPAPVVSIPLRPISERINFLPPRKHLLRTEYVICAQDQPPFRQYLSTNLEIGNYASAHTASANVYDSLEEAQQTLDAYNALFEPAPVAPPIPDPYPSLEGIFKFQLPAFNHALEQYYIPSLSGHEYLWKDLTVRTITPQQFGYYDTYDQALFAKLRYERMHR